MREARDSSSRGTQSCEQHGGGAGKCEAGGVRSPETSHFTVASGQGTNEPTRKSAGLLRDRVGVL